MFKYKYLMCTISQQIPPASPNPGEHPSPHHPAFPQPEESVPLLCRKYSCNPMTMRDRGPSCIPIAWPIIPMCQSPIVGQGVDPPWLIPSLSLEEEISSAQTSPAFTAPPLKISPKAKKSCCSNSETIRAMAIFQGEKRHP